MFFSVKNAVNVVERRNRVELDHERFFSLFQKDPEMDASQLILKDCQYVHS